MREGERGGGGGGRGPFLLPLCQGCHGRLSLPSYAHRLELLVLKEEFFPRLNALQSAIQIMTEAAAGGLRAQP